MRIEPQSRQAAILHLEDGRQLALRVESHALVFAWAGQVIIRLHFRTLRSANSPEETPLFSLESAEASPEWKAQLAPWLAPALALFSQYHGGRVIIAKALAIDLDLPA
ncbi:hypothetical protein [Methylovorus mays]|uniref:hypothetical protein n=1 Tax=Methylovorus mays TaxID=184077 RepID=UPI001E2DA51D|nr:hypothetical protein [Methylovorus mays]MCB5207832.1 hypothetical protein [Methylovorus mays]